MKPFQKRSPPEAALVAGLIVCIDAYKVVLSPLLPGSCRFEPTCSQFAREALVRHGACGASLAIRRILRCRPFGGSGFDPVPDAIGRGRTQQKPEARKKDSWKKDG